MLTPMFVYDSTILAAVSVVPESVSEAIRIMETIEATCDDGDGLKWFNWLYLGVTQAVEARVASGAFSDPAWMAALDVHFAGFYFDALRDSLSGKRAPGCWQALFSQRQQSAIARIQFAMAGINAHINHDLPHTTRTTPRSTPLLTT